ncbi:hypothetical protein WDU94_013009 [Cyamophila willieti]
METSDHFSKLVASYDRHAAPSRFEILQSRHDDDTINITVLLMGCFQNPRCLCGNTALLIELKFTPTPRRPSETAPTT